MPARKGAEAIEKINKKLKAYISKSALPIEVEFAYKNRLRRQYFYENPILADTIKLLIDKKEAQLERLGLEKQIDRTMAIFSLKQLGWKDEGNSLKIPPGKRLIIQDAAE